MADYSHTASLFPRKLGFLILTFIHLKFIVEIRSIMYRKLLFTFLGLWCVLAYAQPVYAQSPNTACKSGSPVQQARCLLRPVGKYGLLGAELVMLPHPMDSLVGKRVGITKSALRSWISRKGLDETDLGGSVFDPVSRDGGTGKNRLYARYFVVEDMSTPVLAQGSTFPEDMDSADWPYNTLTFYPSISHVLVNRLGQSVTKVDFKQALATTKYEDLKPERIGLMLHVALVQPRIQDEIGLDSIAPEPGFTDAQYERLAMLYIVASVRKGYWLVPAFRAGVEAGIPDAHDSPQHFDLRKWASKIGQFIQQI